MKKILCCVLTLLVLCCGVLTVSAAEAGGEKAALVEDYIAEVVPDGAELIDSSVRTFFKETDGRQYTDIGDEISAEAYTYRTTADGKTTYHSVVVLEFLEKISITEHDLLQVDIHDYLRNYSPENGRIFTRKSASDAWGDMKEITPMPSMNAVTVYGSEMKSGSKYTLVLLSFPSDENPEATTTMPEYVIWFTHDTQIRIPLWIAVVCAAAVLAVIGILLWRKRRAS